MEQPLFMHLYAYEGSLYSEPGGGGGLKVENGMDKVEARMNEGVTMLSSLWSGGMRWLDGAASDAPPEGQQHHGWKVYVGWGLLRLHHLRHCHRGHRRDRCQRHLDEVTPSHSVVARQGELRRGQ
ncbi:unnamed protein product [Prorocentrum cordatum]|uniref:Uncharacterized protein n=1 Tax=Prorocentrum cordatum TaxID=2364126 RepID=A0ABN9PGQ7_9DINO|nr:unnamed protein product [Polarella glacialis]